MTTEKKWFDDLPKPKSTPAQIAVHDLHELIQAKADVVVVDVRRADIEVSNPGRLSPTVQPPLACMIPGAINLPAQTFYQTLPASVRLLKQ